MNEERLREIEALIDDANMSAIGEAVEYDSECSEAEREFADNAAAYMRLLIAEVRSLHAKLDAANVTWQEEHAARLVLAEQLKVAEAKAMFWWNEATHPNVGVQP